MKEVHEETGIECEPLRLIAVLDGLRLGFTRVPLYSLVFHCRALGGELKAHPLETADVGWFAEDALPWPLAGAERWGPHAFGALRGEHVDVLFDAPRAPMWRTTIVARRRANRAAARRGRRRSTCVRAVRSHSRPMPSWSTSRRRRAAAPSASVTTRREHRRLDLVAVGGERLEPVPQRSSGAARLAAGRQRVRRRREHLVRVDRGGRR